MTPPLQPLSRSESAASRLRSEILLGDLAPGDLLAESAVATRLGVSRVPVREALFQLEREGLVEFSQTGRAYVKSLSAGDFEELHLLRLTLEPTAARLAKKHFAQYESKLRKNIERTRSTDSLQQLTKLDLDFHQIILEASGNARLAQLWYSLRNELELWLGQLQRSRESQTANAREETVCSHEHLVSTFLTASPEHCEREMRLHILSWREWLPTPEQS
jgi:DNA-binding GntR family transcriptional regulator